MKKKLFILLCIAIIIITTLIILHHKKNKIRIVAPATLVRIAHPLQEALPETLSSTGYLIAENSTSISPRQSGYIKSINFHEGQIVKSGQILFQLDSKKQKAALTAAKANYLMSQLKYHQESQLVKKGYVTKDDYYAAQAALKQDQSALEIAKRNLSDQTIKAPFDGTVGGLTVGLGNYVNSTSTLTTVVDNQHLKVKYSLPVKYLNELQLNQTVNVTDIQNKNKMIATVSYISPAVNQSTQTISVHAEINNTPELFKTGEYVKITQNVGEQKNRLLIPDNCLQAAVDGYSVFIEKNNKAIRVPVKIEKHVNGNVIIASGLKPSDNIIVEGQHQVTNNQIVKEADAQAHAENKTSI